MATSNGSTAIRDKILASLARYRALRIGKFPCAFWRLSSRPGLTAAAPGLLERAKQPLCSLYCLYPPRCNTVLHAHKCKTKQRGFWVCRSAQLTEPQPEGYKLCGSSLASF
ncbi:hypothetical protein [Bathymodiolus platifrons methanotrophic gill symbiont]|uniref:hypothetical protein n=1 Tax=Bathymodiolus platifrons methanotrophic gill symbiont TaxID=113268 RepID=UPI001124F72A|nr:hypothetical protein [Bathymodiolus platifrons methanotrophic gill symbiont]